MSTPLPGQIRCPTCHRSTPPAAFCTQCGSEIPASARARPRGLDREELQERIRTRRPGDAAFRRGSFPGEGPEAPPSPYQPFRPEPEDELIIPPADAPEGAAAAPNVDNTPPGFDERPPLVVPPPVVPPPIPASPTTPASPVAPPPGLAQPVTPSQPTPVLPRVVPPVVAPIAAAAASTLPPATPPPPPVVARQVVPPPVPPPPAEEPGVPAPEWAGAPEGEDDPYGYRYRRSDDDWDDRGSGLSPLAIGGFVLLGVLAIGVGAFIAGVFSGGTAVASPTPTPLVSVAPSVSGAPSLAETPGASVPASPTASNGSGSPLPFPDGFTARTQPCAEEPSSQDGCNSDGSSVTGGSVWVWVGFRKGNDADVLRVSIVDAAGTSVGDGSLELGSINCGASCSGWARFKFGGLGVGNYTIKVNRNDTPAAQATFTVTS